MSAVRGIGSLAAQNSRSKPGLYLAYRYLQEGDAEKARDAAESDSTLTAVQKNLLDVLAAAVEGDYPSVYFSAERVLENDSVSGRQRDCVEELKKISQIYLGQDSSSEEYADLFLAGGEKESALTASGFQVPGQILTLVDRCLEAENIRETEELEDYYLLDSQVRSGNPDAIDSSEVEEMTEKIPGQSGDPEAGGEILCPGGKLRGGGKACQRTAELEPSAENYIIYTDVIAQAVYAGNRADDGDPEKVKLIREAEQAETRAEQYSGNEEKREELLNEAKE